VSTPTLTCQEFVELATDYLEDALPSEERRRFEAHLALCPGCDIYLQQMRQTSKLLGRVTEESLSPAARDELLSVFREWKAGKNPAAADHLESHG
jgi:anti-sigma factor RsiW